MTIINEMQYCPIFSIPIISILELPGLNSTAAKIFSLLDKLPFSCSDQVCGLFATRRED